MPWQPGPVEICDRERRVLRFGAWVAVAGGVFGTISVVALREWASIVTMLYVTGFGAWYLRRHRER